MKWSRRELAGLEDGQVSFEEELQAAPEDLKPYKRIRRLPEAHVKAKGSYDKQTGHLYLHFDIVGTMVVPCDITLEDVNLPFHVDEDAEFAFDEKDPDLYCVTGSILDTLPVELQLIYLEIPIKVVKPGKIQYPRGDGWEVVSEEEYEKSRREEMDPRLAKLRDYKPEE